MMNKQFPIYRVDAFTPKPFSGNPAGVFLYPSTLSSIQMQVIASEVNASETAFPVPLDNSSYQESSQFHLRWFTPEVEVPLCGHATLATAHVLFHEIGNPNEIVTFDTLSGNLIVRREGQNYSMDFPAGIPKQIDIARTVYDALGIEKESVVDNQYCDNPNKLIIVVDNEKDVRELSPDFAMLRNISHEYDVGSVVVTASSSNPDYDFISRNFAPVRGVNEDPVTGSSHVILGPYWKTKLHKSHLIGFQASSRGGSVIVDVLDDARVVLGGTAITVSSGEMLLPEDD
ncbi:MAG: PhzF family phenazine biosynthesis protein [Candidatus Thorarchaeota archaeon]